MTKARDLGKLVSQGQPLADGTIQASEVSGLAAVATSGSYNDLLDKPTSTPGSFSGNYADLTNKPTFATVATSGSYTDLTNKPTLFSGSYSDLTNKPTLFDGSYNTLTDKPTLFSGSYSDLTNKPTLFSGSYSDLTNKPTLFSGSYTDLTDKPNFATVATSGSYVDLNNKPTIDAGPSITSLAYSGNDQATDTTTPLPVTIIGTGFESNSKVYIDTVSNANSATALQFSGTTQITFTPPAKSAASYNVWVVTPTGKMAVLVNGIMYSGTPSWAGVATTYTSLTAVSIQLTATSVDTPLVYSLVSGTLPTGVTLSSSGLLSGTVTGLTADTNFPNIVIRADDPQNQDASITIQLSILLRQQISRSLRFNSADSAYLTRTPSVAGNRKTWTLSWWVKRCKSGVNDELFVTGSSDGFVIRFVTDDTIRIYSWTGSYQLHLITSAVYRDPSAWYHIVFAVDTTQATDTNRAKLYINGTQVTAFSAAVYPTQNQDLLFNQTIQHSIGSNLPWGSTYSNIYMTEVNFVDGQQLTHTSFGETDPDTGVWRPKRYVGTYGTNGFYLNFADNSSATSLTLGKDTSSSGINRIELGNASSGYTVLGTMTFTALLSANAVNLRDGNTSTFAADPNALNNGTTMGYDFGIAVPVRRIVTITAGTYGVDTSTTMNIQYSDDNSTWTTVTGATTQHSITAGLGITNTTNISDNGSHRYWRLAVANGAPTGGNFWFSTLDMYASGIGPNGWYPINFSVASGVGNDSVVDSPTSYGTDTGLGGEVRGNYCTLNPLTTGAGTYTQGNLRYVSNSAWRRSNGTIAVSTGKWYWEVTLANNPNSRSQNADWHSFGFGLSSTSNITATPATQSDLLYLGDHGWYKNFSGGLTDSGVGFAAGDVLSIAVDLDANTFAYRKNNSVIVSGTIGGTAGRELVPIINSYDGSFGIMDVNFGQRPFAYTAPSGFKALCTQNLPTPTIGATTATQAGNYFAPVIYTGTGTARTVTVGFQPDFIWLKSRVSAVWYHQLYDVIRTPLKALFSNATDAETTYTDTLTAFTSNGFNLGTDATFNGPVNKNGDTYVSWNWKANGAGVTNTAGSITSTVSANTTSGFSVVTYTGNGSASATVGHGLGVTPSMIICKSRSNTTAWYVKHTSLASNNNLLLAGTDAAYNVATGSGNGGLGNLTSSTTFGFLSGTSSADAVNLNGGTFVAYCFAEVPGFSAFGSYVGNGIDDGPFILTGFRPAFIMFKRSSGGGNDWRILDSKRTPYNQGNQALYPNTSTTEASAANDAFDILSNGFKMRGTAQASNESGSTYIFAAFAETPFKYALAR